ncbi:MAG: ABC transporter substrate-binding protein [Pirellulaceae bacterium]|nr:ABC transporter substrate-binding protein [Pirellulaceae bacterium]
MSPLWFAICLLSVCPGKTHLYAQKGEQEILQSERKPLYQHEPFDRLVLKDGTGQINIDIFPLSLDQRKSRMPTLLVKRLEDPENEYEIQRSVIIKIEHFENILLNEAVRLTNKDDLDQAFSYFNLLYTTYPKTIGLEKARQHYLYRSIHLAVENEQYLEAFSLTEELRQHNPNYTNESFTLSGAIVSLSQRHFQTLLSQKEYLQAKRFYDYTKEKYPIELNQAHKEWEKVLVAQADAIHTAAEKLYNEGQFNEASIRINEAISLWPELESAQTLAGQIIKKFPLVLVGTTQNTASTEVDLRALGDIHWQSRQKLRLLNRDLIELRKPGLETGVYQSPVGTFTHNPAKTDFSLSLNPKIANQLLLTGYELSNLLPKHKELASYFDSYVTSIGVDDIFETSLTFRHKNFVPHALLGVALKEFCQNKNGLKPYFWKVLSHSKNEFHLNPDYLWSSSNQPKQIVELQYQTSQEATESLLLGQVDATLRVHPPLLEKLQTNEKFIVGRYAFPTVHLLLPNLQKKELANYHIRNAITLAISRKQILYDHLEYLPPSEGSPEFGTTLLSGPFPKGMSEDSPHGYAYDDQIAPRNYDLKMAFLMRNIGEKTLELSDPNKIVRKKIILAAPQSEVAQKACSLIKNQLNTVGFDCQILTYTGDPFENRSRWDLLYVELPMWEPYAEAAPLLSQDGMLRCQDSYLNQLLEELVKAKTWRQASHRLKQIHRTVHDNCYVIPLWQTYEYYAHGDHLHGISPQTIHFYQSVEQWTIHSKNLSPLDETR